MCMIAERMCNDYNKMRSFNKYICILYMCVYANDIRVRANAGAH